MGVEERVVVLLNINPYAQNYIAILPQTIPTISLILQQFQIPNCLNELQPIAVPQWNLNEVHSDEQLVDIRRAIGFRQTIKK